MPTRRPSSASLKRKRAQLTKRLPDPEKMLRGSLVERYKKCGKAGCHCAKGKGHGPAWYLSVTLGPGRTRSYYVSAKQKKLVTQYLRNYQKWRKLVEQIMAVNRQLFEQGDLDEGN